MAMGDIDLINGFCGDQRVFPLQVAKYTLNRMDEYVFSVEYGHSRFAMFTKTSRYRISIDRYLRGCTSAQSTRGLFIRRLREKGATTLLFD